MVRTLFGALCALLALAAAAAAADLQKITVGYVPVADFAPLFVAKDKGFFEQHGLDANLISVQLASNVPGAIVAGSLDIGMGTPPMLLVTDESGLDFQAIAAVSRLEENNPFISLIARKQDNVSDAAQLADKKVGVPGFNSSMDVTFRKWMMDRHIPYGDGPGKVHLVEASFPQMHDELAGHKDAVAGFRAALAQGIDDLKANPAEFQSIQVKYLGHASPARPDWSLKLLPSDLAFFGDVSKQVGLIHQQPQIDKMIAP